MRILCDGKRLEKDDQKIWTLDPLLDPLTSTVTLTKASSPRSRLRFPHLCHSRMVWGKGPARRRRRNRSRGAGTRTKNSAWVPPLTLAT